MTTGPLGQGFASAIGFAYGQRFQRGLLDPEAPEGESPFDHNIWVICGEGDIEEGISGEAASLAANQQLGNLTVIFDANRIQIEGDTNLVLAEDVLKRFQAYGWYTDEFSFIHLTAPTRRTSKAWPTPSPRPAPPPRTSRSSSRSTP